MKDEGAGLWHGLKIVSWGLRTVGYAFFAAFSFAVASFLVYQHNLDAWLWLAAGFMFMEWSVRNYRKLRRN